MAEYPHYYAVLGIDPYTADWAMPDAVRRAELAAHAAYGDTLPEVMQMALVVLETEQGRSVYRRLLDLAEAGSGTFALPPKLRETVERQGADELSMMHFVLTPLGGEVFGVQRLPLDMPPPRPGSHTASTAPAAAPVRPSVPRETAQESTRLDTTPDAYGMVNGQPPPLVLGRRVFNWSLCHAYLKQAVHVGEAMHLMWQNPDNGVEWSCRDYQAPLLPPQGYVPGCDYVHVILTDVNERLPRTHTMYATNPPDKMFRPLICWEGMLWYFPWQKHPGTKDPRYSANIAKNYFGLSNEKAKQCDDMIYRYIDAVAYWTLVYAFPSETPSVLKTKGRQFAATWLYHVFGWSERTLRKRYGLVLGK